MRGELPTTIAAAIERCARPSLVFDAERLARNLAEVGEAARAVGATALFAMKSFAHAEVYGLAARELAGFDVASPAEVAAAIAAGAKLISIADPSGRASEAVGGFGGRVIVSCETVDQVRAAPRRAEIAIRVSASITGRDPAIGAILDGSGHRRSRFGVDDEEAIAELARAAAGRPIGIHVHHGPVTATKGERFVATARAAMELAERVGVTPRFVNLGGAWHGVPDLGDALRAIRAAVPGEILLEPGRRIADGAGFACGRIMAARELADRVLCTADLSRICHLRWSAVELVAAPAHNDRGRHTVIVGPTCFEDDTIGEWTVDPAHVAVGARVIVRHVTGYAVGWNTGFGGVASADVVLAQ
ncbi:MAG TPA: hypothetical protein VFP84_26835 [Kofleriaceae bacterium]|nr:hypothetical protein [Kofleriaceae bacterium]